MAKNDYLTMAMAMATATEGDGDEKLERENVPRTASLGFLLSCAFGREARVWRLANDQQHKNNKRGQEESHGER
jgi:hypothetical protein